MKGLVVVCLALSWANSVYGFQKEAQDDSETPLALSGLRSTGSHEVGSEASGLDNIMGLRLSDSTVSGLAIQQPDLQAANKQQKNKQQKGKQQKNKRKKSQRQRNAGGKGRKNNNRRKGGKRGGGGGGGGSGGGGGGGGSSGGGDSSGGFGGMSMPGMPGGGGDGGMGGMPMSPDGLKKKFEQGMQKGIEAGQDMANMAKTQFDQGAETMKNMAKGGFNPQNMQEQFKNGAAMVQDQLKNAPATGQAFMEDMVSQGKEMFG